MGNRKRRQVDDMVIQNRLMGNRKRGKVKHMMDERRLYNQT